MTYQVKVHRDGAVWEAEVPALQWGSHTCAPSLSRLDKYVREIVVLGEDLPDDAEGSLEFDWEIHTGDAQLDAAATAARTARAERDAAERRAIEATREVLRRRTPSLNLSLRDAAFLVGLSHQRVQQEAARLAQDQPERCNHPVTK